MSGTPEEAGAPTFAGRLRDLRRERGLRQRDLAEALGLAQTTIANYEQDTRFPDERTLRAFARYFGVSFDDLLGRAGGVHAAAVHQPLADAAGAYLERLRAGDEPGALDLARGALGEGGDPRPVYLGVLEPCLHEVGRLWETGAIDVAEEHRISAMVERHMAVIRRLGVSGLPAPTGGRFVCVTAHGDQHHLGGRMVADFLELAGWRGSYLGGNLSVRHCLSALEADPPDLLAVSATVRQALHSVQDLIGAIRARGRLRALRVLAGGQLFNAEPGLWKSVGADASARDAAEAVTVASRLAGGRERV